MHAITILGVVSAFGLLFLSMLALCAERGFRPDWKMADFYKSLSPGRRLLLLSLVAMLTVWAGTKDDDAGDSTNSPSVRMSAPRRMLVVQPGVTISESETNLGYRVLAVREGGEIVPPQTDAVTNTAWLFRGGRDDAFRIGMASEPTEADWWLNPEPPWAFPWGDSWAYGLTVFARGEFQPTVHADHLPKPFGETGVSLVPRSKWEAIADGGLESLFWHELTPSNSLVLTWQNALYGRDANAPTNFQAELFGDGSFDYRYPDRTVSYAPVFPFDWDGDGLENSVDPEPLVAGPDAHGTNVEWYNNMCSNVFAAVEGEAGLELAPRHAGVNTNAYYFVDVVAERGPAPIYFTADGPSRLGSPVVVAQAGVTNHVPLLVGAAYSIKATVPINIVATPACVNVSSLGDGSFQLEWPAGLSYVLSEGVANPVIVESVRLNGTFLWEGGCCTLQSGSGIKFQCHGCRCGGCRVDMNYLYEGYVLARRGPSCGCTGNEEAGESAPFVETASGANLSLSFDKPVVIFERAYDNSPTNHVPLRSTETVLTVRACGGIHGGTLTLSTSRLARLGLVDGIRPSGTFTTNLAPYHVFEMVSTNRGALASTGLRDVEVGGELSENGTGDTARMHAAMTSYELRLEAVYTAPENSTCTNRHIYGVGEHIRFNVRPNSSEFVLSAECYDSYGESITHNNTFAGSHTVLLDMERIYAAPIVSTHSSPVCAAVGDVTYRPMLLFVEPSYIVCRKAWKLEDPDVPCLPSGEVGGMAMITRNFVGPMHVSFRGILLAEIPCDDEVVPTGYFATTNYTGPLSHTIGPGAGRTRRVSEGNYWMDDLAGHLLRYDNWSSGELTWNIPIGWFPPTRGVFVRSQIFKPAHETIQDDSSRPLMIGQDGDYTQVFSIDAAGTAKICKHGHWLSRSRSCVIVLDGKVIQTGHPQ